MAGKKGFGEAIIADVLRMKQEGKSYREISEFYGFNDKKVIKQWLVERHNKKMRKVAKGIMPKKKGRPRKSEIGPEEYKDYVIKQLQMENDLLKSFLLELERWDAKK